MGYIIHGMGIVQGVKRRVEHWQQHDFNPGGRLRTNIDRYETAHGGRVDRRDNLRHLSHHKFTLIARQHDQREFSSLHVLLVRTVFISRQHDIETGIFSRREQRPIA